MSEGEWKNTKDFIDAFLQYLWDLSETPQSLSKSTWFSCQLANGILWKDTKWSGEDCLKQEQLEVIRTVVSVSVAGYMGNAVDLDEAQFYDHELTFHKVKRLREFPVPLGILYPIVFNEENDVLMRNKKVQQALEKKKASPLSRHIEVLDEIRIGLLSPLRKGEGKDFLEAVQKLKKGVTDNKYPTELVGFDRDASGKTLLHLLLSRRWNPGNGVNARIVTACTDTVLALAGAAPVALFLRTLDGQSPMHMAFKNENFALGVSLLKLASAAKTEHQNYGGMEWDAKDFEPLVGCALMPKFETHAEQNELRKLVEKELKLPLDAREEVEEEEEDGGKDFCRDETFLSRLRIMLLTVQQGDKNWFETVLECLSLDQSISRQRSCLEESITALISIAKDTLPRPDRWAKINNEQQLELVSFFANKIMNACPLVTMISKHLGFQCFYPIPFINKLFSERKMKIEQPLREDWTTFYDWQLDQEHLLRRAAPAGANRITIKESSTTKGSDIIAEECFCMCEMLKRWIHRGPIEPKFLHTKKLVCAIMEVFAGKCSLQSPQFYISLAEELSLDVEDRAYLKGTILSNTNWATEVSAKWTPNHIYAFLLALTEKLTSLKGSDFSKESVVKKNAKVAETMNIARFDTINSWLSPNTVHTFIQVLDKESHLLEPEEGGEEEFEESDDDNKKLSFEETTNLKFKNSVTVAPNDCQVYHCILGCLRCIDLILKGTKEPSFFNSFSFSCSGEQEQPDDHKSKIIFQLLQMIPFRPERGDRNPPKFQKPLDYGTTIDRILIMTMGFQTHAEEEASAVKCSALKCPSHSFFHLLFGSMVVGNQELTAHLLKLKPQDQKVLEYLKTVKENVKNDKKFVEVFTTRHPLFDFSKCGMDAPTESVNVEETLHNETVPEFYKNYNAFCLHGQEVSLTPSYERETEDLRRKFQSVISKSHPGGSVSIHMVEVNRPQAHDCFSDYFYPVKSEEEEEEEEEERKGNKDDTATEPTIIKYFNVSTPPLQPPFITQFRSIRFLPTDVIEEERENNNSKNEEEKYSVLFSALPSSTCAKEEESNLSSVCPMKCEGGHEMERSSIDECIVYRCQGCNQVADSFKGYNCHQCQFSICAKCTDAFVKWKTNLESMHRPKWEFDTAKSNVTRMTIEDTSDAQKLIITLVKETTEEGGFVPIGRAFVPTAQLALNALKSEMKFDVLDHNEKGKSLIVQLSWSSQQYEEGNETRKTTPPLASRVPLISQSCFANIQHFLSNVSWDKFARPKEDKKQCPLQVLIHVGCIPDNTNPEEVFAAQNFITSGGENGKENKIERCDCVAWFDLSGKVLEMMNVSDIVKKFKSYLELDERTTDETLKGLFEEMYRSNLQGEKLPQRTILVPESAQLKGSGWLFEIPVSYSGQLYTQLREIFDLYDEDESGNADMKELPIMLRAAGFTVTEKQAADLLKKYDANQNGLLEFPELVKLVETEQLQTAQSDEIRTVFDLLDVDKVGSVAVNTVSNLLQKGNEAIGVGEVNAMFAKYKPNDRLTFEQLRDIISPSASSTSSTTANSASKINLSGIQKLCPFANLQVNIAVEMFHHHAKLVIAGSRSPCNLMCTIYRNFSQQTTVEEFVNLLIRLGFTIRKFETDLEIPPRLHLRLLDHVVRLYEDASAQDRDLYTLPRGVGESIHDEHSQNNDGRQIYTASSRYSTFGLFPDIVQRCLSSDLQLTTRIEGLNGITEIYSNRTQAVTATAGHHEMASAVNLLSLEESAQQTLSTVKARGVQYTSITSKEDKKAISSYMESLRSALMNYCKRIDDFIVQLGKESSETAKKPCPEGADVCEEQLPGSDVVNLTSAMHFVCEDGDVAATYKGQGGSKEGDILTWLVNLPKACKANDVCCRSLFISVGQIRMMLLKGQKVMKLLASKEANDLPMKWMKDHKVQDDPVSDFMLSQASPNDMISAFALAGIPTDKAVEMLFATFIYTVDFKDCDCTSLENCEARIAEEKAKRHKKQDPCPACKNAKECAEKAAEEKKSQHRKDATKPGRPDVHGRNSAPWAVANWITRVAHDSSSEEIRQAAQASMPVFDYFIDRVNCALHFLPKTRRVVFRGVGRPLAHLYRLNTYVTFAAFTSTSLVGTESLKFMKKDKKGTFFIIRVHGAAKIHFASWFPEQAEALLPTLTVFRVRAKMSKTILQMLGCEYDIVTMVQEGDENATDEEAVDAVVRSSRYITFVYENYLSQYVESFVSDAPPPQEIKRPLLESVRSLVDQCAKGRLVIIGTGGSGKTSAALACLSYLAKEDGVFPLLISLPTVANINEDGAIDKYAETTTALTSAQMQLLHAKCRVVLLLDSLDECNTITKATLLQGLLRKNPWCAQCTVILSSRDEPLLQHGIDSPLTLLGESDQRIESADEPVKEKAGEPTCVYMQPFSDKDVDKFLQVQSQSYDQEYSVWKAKLDGVVSKQLGRSMHDLTHHPVTLKMICTLIGQGFFDQVESRSITEMSKSDIYNAFINYYVKNALETTEGTLEGKLVFRRVMDQAKQLAGEMLSTNTWHMSVSDFTRILKGFGLGVAVLPTRCEDVNIPSSQVSWWHKSIGEYLAAQFIADSPEAVISTELSKSPVFLENPAVLDFFSEIAMKTLDSIKEFAAVLHRNRSLFFEGRGMFGSNMSKARVAILSNALSLANAVRIPLGQWDLSNTLIHRANLIRCDFHTCEMRNCLIRECSMHFSIFSAADMKSTRFDRCNFGASTTSEAISKKEGRQEEEGTDRERQLLVSYFDAAQLIIGLSKTHISLFDGKTSSLVLHQPHPLGHPHVPVAMAVNGSHIAVATTPSGLLALYEYLPSRQSFLLVGLRHSSEISTSSCQLYMTGRLLFVLGDKALFCFPKATTNPKKEMEGCHCLMGPLLWRMAINCRRLITDFAILKESDKFEESMASFSCANQVFFGGNSVQKTPLTISSSKNKLKGIAFQSSQQKLIVATKKSILFFRSNPQKTGSPPELCFPDQPSGIVNLPSSFASWKMLNTISKLAVSCALQFCLIDLNVQEIVFTFSASLKIFVVPSSCHQVFYSSSLLLKKLKAFEIVVTQSRQVEKRFPLALMERNKFQKEKELLVGIEGNKLLLKITERCERGAKLCKRSWWKYEFASGSFTEITTTAATESGGNVEEAQEEKKPHPEEERLAKTVFLPKEDFYDFSCDGYFLTLRTTSNRHSVCTNYWDNEYEEFYTHASEILCGPGAPPTPETSHTWPNIGQKIPAPLDKNSVNSLPFGVHATCFVEGGALINGGQYLVVIAGREKPAAVMEREFDRGRRYHKGKEKELGDTERDWSEIYVYGRVEDQKPRDLLFFSDEKRSAFGIHYVLLRRICEPVSRSYEAYTLVNPPDNAVVVGKYL